MFYCTFFTWLGLSVLLLTLYLNSVCHGSRTELQPRWFCHAPSIICYLCVWNCWVCSYPVTLLPSFLSFFDLNFACSRCLVCLVLEMKVPAQHPPSPSLSPAPATHLFARTSPSLLWSTGRLMHLPLRACCQPGCALSLWLGRGERVLELLFARHALAGHRFRHGWVGDAAATRCHPQSCHCLVLPGPEHGWSWETLVKSMRVTLAS